jgi:hypothetical protein
LLRVLLTFVTGQFVNRFIENIDGVYVDVLNKIKIIKREVLAGTECFRLTICVARLAINISSCKDPHYIQCVKYNLRVLCPRRKF